MKPKLEQLNQQFDIVAKRILKGKVMLWKAICLIYVYKYIEHICRAMVSHLISLPLLILKFIRDIVLLSHLENIYFFYIFDHIFFQASFQELDEYHRQANIWLQVLDEEIKLGESLKEEDFLEDAVRKYSQLFLWLKLISVTGTARAVKGWNGLRAYRKDLMTRNIMSFREWIWFMSNKCWHSTSLHCLWVLMAENCLIER